MAEKITLMIPAYNEEENILNVLKPVLEWRNADPKNRAVVIVDDGSTDRTREIAEKAGAKVIASGSHSPEGKPLNYGKADAFIQAAHFAKKNGSKVLISLDADILDATPEKINKMLESLNKPIAEGKKQKPNMLIAKAVEGGLMTEPWYTGQYAIRLEALTPLFRRNQKWVHALKNSRFGLENALKYLIPRRKQDPRIIFNTLPALRRGDKTQRTQIAHSDRYFSRRDDLAEEAWELRKINRKAAKNLIKRKKQSLIDKFKHFKRTYNKPK